MVEVTFPSSIRSSYGGAFLALSHGGSEGVIDVANIALADARNINVLSNGEFGGRAAPWYLVARSNAAAWSARSLYAQLFVEQGIVGAIMIISLLLFALVRQLKQLGEGATLAVAIAPAIMGYWRSASSSR